MHARIITQELQAVFYLTHFAFGQNLFSFVGIFLSEGRYANGKSCRHRTVIQFRSSFRHRQPFLSISSAQAP